MKPTSTNRVTTVVLTAVVGALCAVLITGASAQAAPGQLKAHAAETRSASQPRSVSAIFTGRSATGHPARTLAQNSSGAYVTAASSTVGPVISNARLRFGVATAGGAQANTELDQVASIAGESPSIVLSYYDFNQPAPIADLNSVAARGATSLITWEPWAWGGGVNQPAFQSAAIASGTYDAYIRSWGTALAAWGKPVMLRYGHEMNGNWYPWADGVNGNASGSYDAAYRHVHDILAAAGATNVTWVWSPNVPYTGSTPITTEYPGDAYVNEVALDGYNWGTDQVGATWQSPSSIFSGGLTALRSLAPTKPIIIAETASTENGGSKAKWNTDLVAYLNAQTDVTGFVWFDLKKEADWRIDSSTTSASALKTALAARRTVKTAGHKA